MDNSSRFCELRGVIHCFQCWFGHSLRKYPLHDWSIEQKWISILLPLLILYNSKSRVDIYIIHSSLSTLYAHPTATANRSVVSHDVLGEFLGARYAGRDSTDHLPVRHPHVLALRLSRTQTGIVIALQWKIYLRCLFI